MAEKISELTGEAREQRIAELKKKMQAAAKKAQAAHASGESAVPAAAPAARAQAPAAQATAEQVAEKAPAAVAAPAGNGAATPKVAAPRSATAPATITAPKPAAKPKPAAAAVETGPSSEEMNRREFLTYAWGAALGLLTLEGGVISYFFMYPRFRAGEFGGKFFLQASEIPDQSAEPVPNTSGKFWLVSTEEGTPKALYMVCTHLGCLYKWEPSNTRFECPCHGSKFTHDGFYIEGPAPRSLDYFEISEENGQVVVDTGARVVGDPASESPARAAV